jgi:hypothetical protein
MTEVLRGGEGGAQLWPEWGGRGESTMRKAASGQYEGWGDGFSCIRKDRLRL